MMLCAIGENDILFFAKTWSSFWHLLSPFLSFLSLARDDESDWCLRRVIVILICEDAQAFHAFRLQFVLWQHAFDGALQNFRQRHIGG
jgi:hypothetical protein